MVVIKNYKVPIYKVLGVCGLELTSPQTSNADLYLDNKQELFIEYFNKKPAQIFAINSKNQSTIVHSNTLGLLASNIKDPSTNKHFFFKIKLPEHYITIADTMKKLKEVCNYIFIDYYIKDDYIYHNLTDNIVKLLEQDLFPSTPILDISLHYSLQYPLVKSIRNLKNQFKITLDIPSQDLEIKLKSDNIFELNKLSLNSVSLNPFILDFKLFTKHSFYKLYKEETFLSDLTEDFSLESNCISETLSYNTRPPFEYTTIGYLTEYSNLHVVLPSIKTYVYIDLTTKNIVVSPTPFVLTSTDYLLIAVITKKTIVKDIVSNSFKKNKRFLANYRKLFINSREVDINTIPVGSLSFVYSLRDAIRNKQSVLESDQFTIYQVAKQQLWEDVEVKLADSLLLDLLESLKEEVISYFSDDVQTTNTTNYNYEIIYK